MHAINESPKRLDQIQLVEQHHYCGFSGGREEISDSGQFQTKGVELQATGLSFRIPCLVSLLIHAWPCDSTLF